MYFCMYKGSTMCTLFEELYNVYMCTLFLPPQTPPQAPPTATDPYHCIDLKSYLFLNSFFIDFFSVLGSIWEAKMEPKPENNGKNGCSNPKFLFYRFFVQFLLPLERAEH